MKRIVGIWAGVGVLVAGFWAVYAALTFPELMQSKPLVWVLAQATCPIAFASMYFHWPVRLYWALVANAATYALVGLIAETVRRQFRHA